MCKVLHLIMKKINKLEGVNLKTEIGIDVCNKCYSSLATDMWLTTTYVYHDHNNNSCYIQNNSDLLQD